MNDQEHIKLSRRKFLKKTAYTAPSLLVLGKLLEPTSLVAAGLPGPSGPVTGGPLFAPAQSNARVRPTR